MQSIYEQKPAFPKLIWLSIGIYKSVLVIRTCVCASLCQTICHDSLALPIAIRTSFFRSLASSGTSRSG